MALALALLALAADGPVDFVWLEGEASPPTAPLAIVSQGDYLSGGKWLTATAAIPATGVTATWPFAAPAAGQYDVWARLGYAGDAAPFRWRMAGRPWADEPGDSSPHDLGALDTGLLVGWVKLGTVDLPGGPHRFELHLPAGPPRFALDAVCLIRGPFFPDGPHKPGTVRRTALDWEAATRPFEFPPTAPNSLPHERRVLDLSGLWQAARWDEVEVVERASPIKLLPPDLAARPWRGVRIPGELTDTRPDWAFAHRYLLRARLQLPTDTAGRSVTLRLPSVALQASVFVNGRLVGNTAVPYCPLTCDLGTAIRPGLNDLVIAIKDNYYAVAGVPWAKLRLLPPARFASSEQTRTLDWPVRTTRRGGLLEAPTLTLAGSVFVADVFPRPQVSAGRLAVDVTVRNPTDTPRTVEVQPVIRPSEADGRVVGGRPAKSFRSQPVTVPAGREATVTFDESWSNPRPWWPDDPYQYTVETNLILDGQPVDEQLTRFGFREWGIAGSRVTLNGVPWKLSADGRLANPQPGSLARQAVRDWRIAGVSLFRYAAERPWTGSSPADTLGFFDASGVPVLRAMPDSDGILANRQALFLARVRAERNHPAIAVWERSSGIDPEAVRAIDPTRPVLPAVAHVVPRPGVESETLAGGAGATGGRFITETRTRRLAEQDRWREVAVSRFDGIGPSTGWQPVAVLIEEPETIVMSGQPLTRTLRLFNDTRSGTPITVHWLFRVRGRAGEARGKRIIKLVPGGRESFPLTLAMPPGEQLEAELVLSCERDGRELFRDIRPLTLIGH